MGEFVKRKRRVQLALLAAGALGLGLSAAAAPPASAITQLTGCGWGVEGSNWSWASCTGGVGTYNAWAQCKPTSWWRSWKMAYGAIRSPGISASAVSEANCGSGYVVSSYGITYR